jgi:branched-chain amino acid transport system permease protein
MTGQSESGLSRSVPKTGHAVLSARYSVLKDALTMGWRGPFLWITLLLIAVVAAIPILTANVTLREDLFLILQVVVFASSINIITGYTGYVSFGHIVFMGLGGYIAFFLMLNLGMNFVLAALIAGGVTSAFALLLGIPILRLRGAYFALATIGILEAVQSFVTNFGPFGSSNGMTFNFALYDAYGGAKNAGQYAYYAMVVITLLTVATSYLIKKSKFGLGLMAIREDQDAAQVLGINPARYKLIAYVISAFFPALAGAVLYFKNGTIEPDIAFPLLASIEGLVMMMLGGYGTVSGPIVGALVYDRLRATLLTSDIFSSLHLFIAGLLLLLIVLFVTGGVVGWLRQHLPVLRRALE